jgi:hypothetical protein
LKQELEIDTALIEGNRGEFSVWVGESCIADKDLKRCEEFPDNTRIVEKARGLLSL